MANYGTSGDGIFVNFTHEDVQRIENSEDVTAAAASVLSAAVPVVGAALGPGAGVAGVVLAGLAGTVAVHKVEFQQADKGGGVEVTLPWWAIALGWWGALLMKPLPRPTPAPPPGPVPQVVPPSHIAQGAFQANTGNLWVVGADNRGDTGLGMMAGTSPSIAGLPGGWQAAFQANTGALWVVGRDNRGDMHLGMMAGTSPSII